MNLTEGELRDAIDRLIEKINDGRGTIDDANQLAELNRQLKRIEAVKYGRTW